MSKPRSRIKLPVLLPWLLFSFAARAGAYQVFPNSWELFKPLLADPREIQLGASYYRFHGNNDADVALGRDWGLTRWQSADGLWLWQWDIEGMAYSRFQIGAGVNKFETVDFFANLPIEVRRGSFSGKFYLYHESSHLGDDYIRDTGNTGFRYSVEGVRAVLSEDIGRFLRVYGGGGYLIHSIPAPQRGDLQAGFELTGPDLRFLKSSIAKPYFAQDVQSHQNAGWNLNSNTTAGLRFDARAGAKRSVRAFIGYFTGHSPYGQFYFLPEHYAFIGLGFDY
ncbi:MAG: DUF1207 domain-containing protein [Elusimicrobiota bacterium]